MAANITLAAKALANGSTQWVAGRKMVFITATGATTIADDTGSIDLKAYMSNPDHAVVPGCSVAISDTTLTVTAEIGLGNAVTHGQVFSTVGDI
jgi:hypothetical protein